MATMGWLLRDLYIYQPEEDKNAVAPIASES
jgi:hypothetical protein